MFKVLLFVLLGLLVFLLERLNKAKGREDYSFESFVGKNWIPAVLNIISACLVIFGLGINEGAFIYAGKDLTFIFAGLFGASGHMIWTGISNALRKNVKTAIGINSKK